MDNRRLMDDYLRALLANEDFGRFLADDVLWTTMETGEEVRGRHAVRDLILALHTQLFDARVEVRGLGVDGDHAMLEAVFDGTHTGEMAGVPASGAHVRLPYAVGYDLAGDHITALRAYFPMTQLVTQLRDATAATAA